MMAAGDPRSGITASIMQDRHVPTNRLRVPDSISLNPEQAAAVAFDGGHCLVLAGAESGSEALALRGVGALDLDPLLNPQGMRRTPVRETTCARLFRLFGRVAISWKLTRTPASQPRSVRAPLDARHRAPLPGPRSARRTASQASPVAARRPGASRRSTGRHVVPCPQA